MDFNQKISSLQDELRFLREQKGVAERMLLEKIENLKQQELELVRKEEKMKRWQNELDNYELQRAKSVTTKMSQDHDLERLRQKSVDDAHLIERLRALVEGCREGTNDMIGVMGVVQSFFEELGRDYADTVDDKMSAIYDEIGSIKVANAEHEVVPALKELRLAVQSYIHFSKAKILNYLRTNPSNRLPTKNTIIDSPPQRDEWNVPQRINQLTSFNLNTSNDAGVNDGAMRLQATTDNLKASLDQVQQEREKQAILRTKLETIEESQHIDKQHILEIEQLLRKVVAFKSLDGKLSRVVSDNLENVRATIVLKHEKCVQSKQL